VSYDGNECKPLMHGREFAEKVNQYLQSRGEETHGVGVIQSNPDQSKHLETATMRVHGIWQAQLHTSPCTSPVQLP